MGLHGPRLGLPRCRSPTRRSRPGRLSCLKHSYTWSLTQLHTITVLITCLTPTTTMVVVAATGSSIQLLASTASYAFSSTAIPLARNRGSPVTRITTKHVVFPAVGRTVCYNRPLVRPKNYGLENGFLRSKSSLNANAGTRTNGGGGSRSTNSCGSSRKFSTQGPSGTFYSTAGNSTSTTNGGVSGSPYASEAYTMFDKLFSTLLKGRRTQGKGKKKARPRMIMSLPKEADRSMGL